MGHFSYVLHKKTKNFILKNPLFKFQMNCALGTATPNAMRGERGSAISCGVAREAAAPARTRAGVAFLFIFISHIFSYYRSCIHLH